MDGDAEMDEDCEELIPEMCVVCEMAKQHEEFKPRCLDLLARVNENC